MAQSSQYNVPLAHEQPAPGTTPTQVLNLSNTAIVNGDTSDVSAASKAAQVAPAIVLPTADPMVKGAIYISNTTTGTISVSNQAT